MDKPTDKTLNLQAGGSGGFVSRLPRGASFVFPPQPSVWTKLKEKL
jgi:hypothetical protein